MNNKEGAMAGIGKGFGDPSVRHRDALWLSRLTVTYLVRQFVPILNAFYDIDTVVIHNLLIHLDKDSDSSHF
jgi:hypothetical protein